MSTVKHFEIKLWRLHERIYLQKLRRTAPVSKCQYGCRSSGGVSFLSLDSLAIVFYSDSVETDASQIENSGWFLPAEIVKMTDKMENATND